MEPIKRYILIVTLAVFGSVVIASVSPDRAGQSGVTLDTVAAAVAQGAAYYASQFTMDTPAQRGDRMQALSTPGILALGAGGAGVAETPVSKQRPSACGGQNTKARMVDWVWLSHAAISIGFLVYSGFLVMACFSLTDRDEIAGIRLVRGRPSDPMHVASGGGSAGSFRGETGMEKRIMSDHREEAASIGAST